jgi:hypothetical protein
MIRAERDVNCSNWSFHGQQQSQRDDVCSGTPDECRNVLDISQAFISERVSSKNTGWEMLLSSDIRFLRNFLLHDGKQKAEREIAQSLSFLFLAV